MGLDASLAQGAMYVWARVVQGDGQAYAAQALESAHVSLTPGQAFGPGGQDFVRFSLGISDDELGTALERLKDWYMQGHGS
jgi:aspartate/methionine/tyrosine aminotransferase